MIIRWQGRGHHLLVPGAFAFTWRMGAGSVPAGLWWANQSGAQYAWNNQTGPQYAWVNQSVGG